MAETKTIQLPPSLVKHMQQNPHEDIITLCVSDIIAVQLQQKNTTETTKQKLTSTEFQAKLASQIFTKSLQKTLLENPQFTQHALLKNSNLDGQQSSEFMQKISKLKQENTDFAKQFTLNIFDSYLLVHTAIMKD